MVHPFEVHSNLSELPLFAWAAEQRITIPSTLAERQLVHQLNIPIYLARTLCEQNGLGVRHG